MVRGLDPPPDPLPRAGATVTWKRPPARAAGGRSPSRWAWCRVYHQGSHNPNGHSPRTFGPLARFDTHLPDAAGRPQVDPHRRSVLYVGADLATSMCEVFGELSEALVCPRWRVAVLEPVSAAGLRLFDLCKPGAALAIGALPALADAALPRALTQQWARAIYNQQPTAPRTPVTGVQYSSAYNGGRSLALWDCAGSVATVVDAGGAPADQPLSHPGIRARLEKQLLERRIAIKLVDPRDCPLCMPDPLP